VKEVSGAVSKVIFPVYARLQDQPEALSRSFLLTMRYVNLLTAPMGLGLALVAEPFVLTFFSERWVEAIPVMRAIAIYTLLRALVFNSGDVYKAQGRPGLLAQIKVVQIIISLPALWWAAARLDSLVAVALTQVGLVAVAGVAKLVIAGRVLNVPLRQIGGALAPSLLAGGVMSLFVFGALLAMAGLAPWVQLAGATVVGVAAYVAALFFVERPLVRQSVALAQRIWQARFGRKAVEK
jgi:O-antigen/teichoic acid export membrane protein